MNMKTILLLFVAVACVAASGCTDEPDYQDAEFLEFADDAFEIMNADIEAGNWQALHDHAQSAMIEGDAFVVSDDLKSTQTKFHEVALDYSTAASFMMKGTTEDTELAVITLEQGTTAYSEFQEMTA